MFARILNSLVVKPCLKAYHIVPMWTWNVYTPKHIGVTKWTKWFWNIMVKKSRINKPSLFIQKNELRTREDCSIYRTALDNWIHIPRYKKERNERKYSEKDLLNNVRVMFENNVLCYRDPNRMMHIISRGICFTQTFELR